MGAAYQPVTFSPGFVGRGSTYVLGSIRGDYVLSSFIGRGSNYLSGSIRGESGASSKNFPSGKLVALSFSFSNAVSRIHTYGHPSTILTIVLKPQHAW